MEICNLFSTHFYINIFLMYAFTFFIGCHLANRWPRVQAFGTYMLLMWLIIFPSYNMWYYMIGVNL